MRDKRNIWFFAIGVLVLLANGVNGAVLPGYQLVNAFGTTTFNQPVCVRTPPGETNRVFVLEKGGLIQVVTNIGATTPGKSLYIDLRNNLSTSGEQGLLGLVFHPQFQSNGYFYIYRSYAPGSLVYERLSRFQANPPRGPTALASTEVVLFDQQDGANNHNGGDLHFGNDGYLYISLGDGGLGNDQLNNSQTIRKGFQSGMLRIDVDNLPANLRPNPASSISQLSVTANYSVPADNPFVTDTFLWERNTNVPPTSIRTEFWAVGFRNPWRFSIDPVTGWVWVGDVGEGTREEVDVLTAGGDYGWVYREGIVGGPVSAPAGFASIPPIFDYPHGTIATNVGNCVIGGIVYRGDRLRELIGAYVFCDYAIGNIWALRYNGTTTSDFHSLLRNGSALRQTGIAGFGTDPRNGDILMADYDHGLVRRLQPAPPTVTITLGPGPEQYNLSWPSLPDAFDLYAASELTTPISWSSVTTPPVLANGNWTITVEATDPSRFYCLQTR